MNSKFIQKNQAAFKCPVCGGTMAIKNHNSLICKNGHCFDLSRTGYLNLLASRNNAVYSKELFEARHQICFKGFYDPLIEALGETIQKYREVSNIANLSILDAGCGEGSHLYHLSRRMKDSSEYSLFGVDIAKEGVKIASKNDADIVWVVADLAKLPFRNSIFNVILNILSPANYLEFERVLASEGIIIKVVPEKSYLEELRTVIYDSNNYSNDKIIDYFSNKLTLVSKQNIRYQFDVDETVLPQLIKMTPLTWGGNTGESDSLHKINLKSVTVDLTIIVGRKKS